MLVEGEIKKLKWDDTIPKNSGALRSRAGLLDNSFRAQVTFSERRFDVNTLPVDLHRVYKHLERDFGKEYALTVIFIIRTGVELHRAWHMTLLTSKILQQLKDKFGIRMTWELGVIKLKFRIEDGAYELHRKVPYDYDSEFQDLYTKIAVALVDGHVNVDQALIYQMDTKHGLNTAKSGLFLRDFPGRLVLYPLEAATCTVIFFSGDWFDASIAAICGLVAGLIEYFLVSIGGNAKILTDVLVGTSTGAIAGIAYRYFGETTCMPAIFLGTLYWFFYGTAFVLGILEIISGELETGVVRFMAVSVKTFILTLGTTFGMQLTLANSLDAWRDQNGNCGNINLDAEWYRIPLYLLCSASALGQYRFPIKDYWRGLVVQLVGYEVQYQALRELGKRHQKDFLDTAASNVGGAVAAVIAASILSQIIDSLSSYYNARVLQRHTGKYSAFGEFMYSSNVFYVRFSNWFGFGKKGDVTFLNLTEKLKTQSIELNDPIHTRAAIVLTPIEEDLLLDAIVDAEGLNLWALLMPTVYQLVPGSLIAKLWFNAVFPPALETESLTIDGTDLQYKSVTPDQLQEAVFQALMVVAASLAIGLLLGFGIVEAATFLLKKTFCCFKSWDPTGSWRESQKRKESRANFNYTVEEDDPEPDADEEEDYVAEPEPEPKVPDEEDGIVLNPSLASGNFVSESKDEAALETPIVKEVINATAPHKTE
mmetsp:Transcript_19673/g.29034  ORF Transcript_19673/g.29034 Transcript_19673/m.29034 type:complete len:708 (-) Transcript_19673:160-2283(-)